ncbi:MAG: YitT family protein [Oscillospiraceae bacterium]|nr:YitT family protein [Oscillospiraceae bacterium]
MKPYFKQKTALILAKNILLTVIGTLTLAFGSAVFIIPFNLVCGGVTGISIAISSIIKSELVTTESLIALLTWALFFVGFLILGRSFALKTLLSAVIYPIAISLFTKLTSPNVLGGFFVFDAERYGQISLILAALFGGVFIGAGCAITFFGGGSTGGTDIIAFSICKFFKNLKSSYVIFAIDGAVIVFGMFALKNFVLSLLGILSAFITALVIDKLFLGESGAFIAQIVSEKSGEISDAIIKNLERTTTFFDVTGGYSKSGRKLIMVSFRREQYLELIRLITKIDERAFVTVHRAHEVRGEGWNK